MAALSMIIRALVHPHRLQTLHICRSDLSLALVEMFIIAEIHKSGQYYCIDY